MNRTTPIILEKDPSANLDDVARVASVWDEVVNSIVKEMIAYSSQKTNEVHINLREEMVLELAKLTFFLSTKVVEDRMRGKAVSDIDALVEQQECFGPNGQTKIYNTAKNCAEQIWIKKYRVRWEPKTKAALEKEKKPKRTVLSPKPVKKNHFIPISFIKRYWAEGEFVIRNLRFAHFKLRSQIR